MSQLFVDNIKNRTGGAIGAPSGAVVTGVATATQFSGNVTGVAATFTGNVSIGGTLTYEDVTNIDSVGVITARTGIKVLAGGINVVGVVTATSFFGDGSGLTGLSTFSGNYNDLTNTPSIASQAEAEAGTNNTNLMTPLRVKQAIDALGGSVINSIQRGTIALSGSTASITSVTATISSVTMSKTMISNLGNDLSGTADTRGAFVRLSLTSSTQITSTRLNVGSATVSYEVIEFA